MERLRVDEVVRATGGRLLRGHTRLAVPGISTDSRTIRKGELFVALKGCKYDGHDFVEEVSEKGALGAIVSRKLSGNGCKLKIIIEVKDTLIALQRIAHHYRKKFDVRIAAITGSNGKTTTKDMAASILSRRFNTLKAEASFNNQVGVPLSLLRLSPEHEVALLELGMNARGEIAELTKLVEPHLGLITNVGPAHLGFFRNVEEIAEAKAELVQSLDREKTIILNRDDELVWAMASKTGASVLSFGIRNKADFQATDIEEFPDGRVAFTLNGSVRIRLPTMGYFNVYNALAAAALSSTFHLSPDVIKEGLEGFTASPMRMQLLSLGSVRLINDAYNANPASMEAALKLMASLQVKGRKVAVLGDMLELGTSARALHQDIGSKAASYVDVLVAVGELSRSLAESARRAGMRDVYTFPDSRTAGRKLVGIIRPGDTVLVKGSRLMRMEEVVNVLSSLPHPA